MPQSTFHEPVLRDEAVSYLITDTDGVYVDGTLGGAGHAGRILSETGPNGRLYGIDQDEESIEEARKHFGQDSRFYAIRGNFGFMRTLLPAELQGETHGILLDLGVSSHQIDRPERGFSFQSEGPLDMRMSSLLGRTAYDVVNEYDYRRLRDLVFHYGEEKNSRKIAWAIISRRPLETTEDLRDAVASVTPERFLNKTLARVFQALRIEVNRELEMLERALEQGLELLRYRGRFVVISYHSLEDRLVKNFFRSGNSEGKVQKDFYGNDLSPYRPVTRKAVKPAREEVERNQRARSARLRAAERTEVAV